jgi:hypothetical protein
MMPYVSVALVSFTILTFVVVYNSLCCLVNICANKTTNKTGTSNIVIQLKQGYQILVFVVVYNSLCCLVNICANKTTNKTGTSNIVIQLKQGYQILVLIKILPTNCYSIALENAAYQSTVFTVGHDMFRITL